jgi:RNA polymerase sigma-70 factor (ECF subfamily)
MPCLFFSALYTAPAHRRSRSFLNPNFQKKRTEELKMSSSEKQELIAIEYNGEEVMVSQEVADFLDDCRRDAHRQYKQDLRNRSGMRCEEYLIEDLMAHKPTGFEDELIRRLDIERLPEALAALSEIQRRRVTAYYYEGLSYREIAVREGVNHTKIAKSIDAALKKLKSFYEA